MKQNKHLIYHDGRMFPMIRDADDFNKIIAKMHENWDEDIKNIRKLKKKE